MSSDNHPEIERRIAVMETTLESVQRSLADLGGALRSISDRVNERSQTDWRLIISMISIVVVIATALWGLAIQPLQGDLTDIKAWMNNTSENRYTTSDRERDLAADARYDGLYRDFMATRMELVGVKHNDLVRSVDRGHEHLRRNDERIEARLERLEDIFNTAVILPALRGPKSL